MGRTLRLFVAAYPPRPAVERWLAAAREVLPPAVRLTDADQVHLTLVFLGDREERDLPDIRESITRSIAACEPITLSPIELVMLPESQPPRLLAVKTSSPGSLTELQRRLSQRLALDRQKESVFLPHITLARFPGRAIDRKSRPLAEDEFEFAEVHLVKSRLRPGGSLHETDKVFPLRPR